MKHVNLILIFDNKRENVLMCHRQSNPYKGLYNFVGGKKEDCESLDEAAYRELLEETNITKNDVTLRHMMNYQYILDNLEMNIYYGILKHPVKLIEEKHPLRWFPMNTNFMDSIFAGDGNTYHMVKLAQYYMNKNEQSSL